jgi:phenylacetate-CoA ligase
MKQSRLPLYYKSIDWDALFAETPPPDVWYETMFLGWSADQLRAYQDHHFRKVVAIAWENDFYNRRWRDAGLEPGDINSLDHLEKIPSFDSEDLKNSIEAHPPFGDFPGIVPAEFQHSTPLKLQTSGGTTGLPRPTLYGPREWEYNALQLAKSMYAQGVRPGDVMQIPVTLSLANMGWGYYKACHDYLGVLPVTTGTGLVTPSRRQLQLAERYGVNSWVSFPEYMTQLAKVMHDEFGRDVRELKTKYISTYLGTDIDNGLRRYVEDLWGCDAYDNYGVHDAGSLAFEGEEKDGLYLIEDSCFIEFLDVDTNRPVDSGTAGNICVTSLHRTVMPLIRYNLRDLGRVKYESGTSALGSNYRRMDKFLGRSDQMVKIRGVNIYPMACLAAVRSDDRSTGEWICIATRHSSQGVLRDEMTVRIEIRNDGRSRDGLLEHYERRLQTDLGIKINVELVDEGNLPETNVGKEGKPQRLIDKRKAMVEG